MLLKTNGTIELTFCIDISESYWNTNNNNSNKMRSMLAPTEVGGVVPTKNVVREGFRWIVGVGVSSQK